MSITEDQENLHNQLKRIAMAYISKTKFLPSHIKPSVREVLIAHINLTIRFLGSMELLWMREKQHPESTVEEVPTNGNGESPKGECKQIPCESCIHGQTYDDDRKVLCQKGFEIGSPECVDNNKGY